jgi:hypothetical protein
MRTKADGLIATLAVVASGMVLKPWVLSGMWLELPR